MLLRRPEPVPIKEQLVVVLDALEKLDQIIRLLENDVLLLVTEAHFRGATWAEIAARLHRAKQTVHQRYQAQVHSPRTRDQLLRDVAEAERHARLVCQTAAGAGVTARAQRFLRERRAG